MNSTILNDAIKFLIANGNRAWFGELQYWNLSAREPDYKIVAPGKNVGGPAA
jgi:hypothetical protein